MKDFFSRNRDDANFGAGLILFIGLCLSIACMLDAHSRSVQAEASSPVAADLTPSKRPGYVGDGACMPCHKEQSLAYARTSHHMTSQLPGKTSILGSFNEG